MQALLRTHSKSKEYDPKDPDVELIVKCGSQHDEIGVIQSICVKVCGDQCRQKHSENTT
jgi:hypothetical protein